MSTPNKERSLSLPQRPLLQSSRTLIRIVYNASGTTESSVVFAGTDEQRVWGLASPSNTYGQTGTHFGVSQACFSGRRFENTRGGWKGRDASRCPELFPLPVFGKESAKQTEEIDPIYFGGKSSLLDSKEFARDCRCILFLLFLVFR